MDRNPRLRASSREVSTEPAYFIYHTVDDA
jgi:hypothetical protein